MRAHTRAGVAITDQAIHAVRLTVTDRPTLVEARTVPMPDGLISHATVTDPAGLAALLRQVTDLTRRARTTLAVPTPPTGTDSDTVDVPDSPDGTAWPLPVDRDALTGLADAARQAGLRPAAIEPAGLSMLRGALTGRATDGHTDIVVDLHRHTTIVAVAVNGWPAALRTTGGGTDTTMRRAAELLHVTPTAAMRMVADGDPNTTMRISAHLHLLAHHTATAVTDTTPTMSQPAAGTLRLWAPDPLLALPPYLDALTDSLHVTAMPARADLPDTSPQDTTALGAALHGLPLR